jgi:tRNA 2-thiouridine synthesizing protein A
MRMRINTTLDAKGFSCPMPIVKLAQKIKELNQGEILKLLADDIGAREDVPAWCKRTGNELKGIEEKDGVLIFYIKKLNCTGKGT